MNEDRKEEKGNIIKESEGSNSAENDCIKTKTKMEKQGKVDYEWEETEKDEEDN